MRPGITTSQIDDLIETARKVGAIGAKACGAGGGGCVFFLVEKGTRTKVGEAIERAGAKVLPVKVAPRGVKVEVTRDTPSASAARVSSR